MSQYHGERSRSHVRDVAALPTSCAANPSTSTTVAAPIAQARRPVAAPTANAMLAWNITSA